MMGEGSLRELRLGEAGYPAWLATVPDAPPLLICQGTPELLDRTAVALVGARRASALGLALAGQLGAGLARAGVVVVSGCAIGVDAAAHRGALQAGGSTVAVLGGGLDVAAPTSNRGLAAEIAARGCLVSEFPPGTPPLKHHFPRRNRIIAGLARIVVVVEAGATSGALITARLALAAGREVMAVPGHPLLATSVGANALLSDGARPACALRDILDELASLPGGWSLPGSTGAEPAAPPFAPPSTTGTAGDAVARVAAALSAAPASAEELARAAGVPMAAALAALTELELLDLARAHAGQRFSRREPRDRAAARPAPAR
ncbi:MAG: DNA-processing protein DprA [Gemmatimonadota bacterium]